jgi:hypothetical protein
MQVTDRIASLSHIRHLFFGFSVFAKGDANVPKVHTRHRFSENRSSAKN